MSVEEFYITIGGNYNNILERLGEKTFIQKFIIRFLDDTSFALLNEDIKNKDFEKANFDAHSLKGVCAVLEFTKLKELTEQFSLCLKQGKDYEYVWQMLENEYNFIIQTINKSNWINWI